MVETRIEKYREYRKSIINGDSLLKTPIATSLKATSKESQTSPTEQEAVFLRKINRREVFSNVAFIIFLLAIIVPLVAFGFILF